MSFNAPKSPDPVATSNAQLQYNKDAAKTQQGLNSFNQATPFGSVTYVPDPSSPSGYRITTALSEPQQQLLDTRTATQGVAGRTAQDLLRNTSGMYSQPPDLTSATGAVADKLNEWNARYLQPIFNQQDSVLEAKLRNQGLTPGSQAYNNAKNLLARNQGDVTTNYLTKNQGQAFNQALTEYGLPLQTVGSLFGMSAPTSPTFQNAPSVQIQPPNYAGQVQQNYQNELQNYQNTWNNIGKLAGAGVSLAMAPMTGGTSLAGGIGSMFGSSPGGTASTFNYGGQSWPAFT
jgi:hypothetical protein